MAEHGYWLQIVSSLVGSSFILFVLTTFYNDFYNKPDINIQVGKSMPSTNLTNSTINIKNIGRVPATHLWLTVSIPKKALYHFLNRTSISSTENSSLPKTTPKDIYLPINRLAHGNGIVRIDAVVSGRIDNLQHNLSVYATYDQGSASSVQNPDLPLSNNVIVIGIISSIVAFSVAIIDLIRRQYNRKQKMEEEVELMRRNELIKRTKAQLEGLTSIERELERIISIRRSLKNDALHSKPLSYELSKNFERKLISTNPSDYVIIDDFVVELDKRNNYISQDKINDGELRQYNERCAALAHELLKQIDWKKYK
jgi:hypothetical protein